MAIRLVQAQFWPKFVPQRFFLWTLPVLDGIHCCKLSLFAISRKTNELNLRKWLKTQFGPNFLPKFGPQRFFLWILPVLDLRHCCKLSLYAISRKINEPKLRKCKKTQFQAPFWPKFGPKDFFCGFTSTRYCTLLKAVIVCYFKEN